VANRRGFFDGLQARRPFPPGVVAVIRGLRSRRYNQRVVVKHAAVAQNDALGLRINVDGFTQQNLRIFLAAQNTAQRSCNFSRRERTGGHLVQQRLKKVKISAVNQRDLCRCPFQFLCRDQSAESAAKNNHPVLFRHPPPPNATSLAQISSHLM